MKIPNYKICYTISKVKEYWKNVPKNILNKCLNNII